MSYQKKIDWRNKVILIVEDEELNFIFLKEALFYTNVKVLWARNGIEAISLFQENRKDIKIILMDIKMPGMDGFESTNRIKEIDSSIPVIAQTAFANSKDDESRKADFIECLIKPIKTSHLLKTVEKHILCDN